MGHRIPVLAVRLAQTVPPGQFAMDTQEVPQVEQSELKAVAGDAPAGKLLKCNRLLGGAQQQQDRQVDGLVQMVPDTGVQSVQVGRVKLSAVRQSAHVREDAGCQCAAEVEGVQEHAAAAFQHGV